ncbi:MAG TPA: hypothetical protein VIE69_01925, partial [Methylophilaceae bacterium]
SIAKADSIAVLLNQYIDAKDICIFYNSPPGQHGVLPIGGDENIDPNSEFAHQYAIATGATAGVAAGAIGLFGGPIVALATAGIAAYTGSLLGAMGGMDDEDKSTEPPRRQSGVFLAVHMANPDDKQRIISTLKAGQAEDIELAQGIWRNGDWVDFNPVEAPHLEH